MKGGRIMSISKRDQKLLLVLAALAVFLACYLLIIAPINNKKEAVQAQINTLAPQLEELRGYEANQAVYQSETEKIKNSVNAALSQYPSEVRSEDMVMYSTELADKIGISVESISINPPTVLSTFSIPKQTGQTYEMAANAVLKAGFTVSCKLNYEQMKSLIDYIYKKSKQTTLDSISVSYNSETGNLLGTAAINKYFIVSSDYSYMPTSIPEVSKGIDDLFGTFPADNSQKSDATSGTDITQ